MLEVSGTPDYGNCSLPKSRRRILFGIRVIELRRPCGLDDLWNGLFLKNRRRISRGFTAQVVAIFGTGNVVNRRQRVARVPSDQMKVLDIFLLYTFLIRRSFTSLTNPFITGSTIAK